MLSKKYCFLLTVLFAAAILAGCQTSGPAPSLQSSFFSDMMMVRDSESARVSSWDRSGGNTDFSGIEPGGVMELAKLDGAGCIRHIYFTIGAEAHYLNDLVIRMYWDGETEPSVEVPFGAFFGLGMERPRFLNSMMVTTNPGYGRYHGTIGFNTYFPMPFSDGALLTLTNEGGDVVPAVWYHVEYEKLAKLPREAGRFHAQWHRENPTTAIVPPAPGAGINLDGKENYVILDAKGKGNLAGYFLNVENLVGGWYGEGDDMIFIDGEEWPPSFHGTGSEEIFGGGACPNTEYQRPFAGYHIVGNPDFKGKNAMYRFFVADPVRFHKSIKVTIEHGHANDLANDYSSTAFWYQLEPHVPFAPLPPVEDRYPYQGDDPHDVAFELSKQLRGTIYTVLVFDHNGDMTITDELRERLMKELDGVSARLEQGNYTEFIEEAQREIDELVKLVKDAGVITD